MLYKVVLVSRILSESDSAFPVNGFMNPVFHNDGETVAVINNQEIAQGDSFPAEFPGCVLDGTMNIRFIDEAGKTNKLILHHGMVVGEYFGFPMSTEASRLSEQNSFSSGCNR